MFIGGFMTEQDFYNLSYEDMVDVLLQLKMKHNLIGLGKNKILKIAREFREGYKVNNLKAFLIGLSQEGIKKAEQDSEILYNQFKDSVLSNEYYNERLDMEAQRIINMRKTDEAHS